VKEKGKYCTAYVLLDLDQASPGGEQASPRAIDWAAIKARTNKLIAELRAQNERLRTELFIRNEELRRKDTILMTMAQRIPELEPAPEPRESPATAKSAVNEVSPEQKEHRSRSRRLVGR
jgi:hypothetical protein